MDLPGTGQRLACGETFTAAAVRMAMSAIEPIEAVLQPPGRRDHLRADAHLHETSSAGQDFSPVVVPVEIVIQPQPLVSAGQRAGQAAPPGSAGSGPGWHIPLITCSSATPFYHPQPHYPDLTTEHARGRRRLGARFGKTAANGESADEERAGKPGLILRI